MSLLLFILNVFGCGPLQNKKKQSEETKKLEENNEDEYKIDLDYECSVCLEKIEEDEYITKCNHYFHKECIYHWSKINDSCPLCRKKLKKFSNKEIDEITKILYLKKIEKRKKIEFESYENECNGEGLPFALCEQCGLGVYKHSWKRSVCEQYYFHKYCFNLLFKK